MLADQVCVTNREVDPVPPGAQVIILRPLDHHVDTALEVEYQGKRYNLYLSDLEPLGETWERSSRCRGATPAPCAGRPAGA